MTTSLRIMFITTLTLFLLPAFASAAELRMKTNIPYVHVGDTFTVGVSLNTQKESINALDGALNFSSNLKLSSIRLAGSLVPLWIVSPVEKALGTISFAGILPGGYKSPIPPKTSPRQGNVFTLVFTALSSGVARLTFGPRTSAYLNDGKGTYTQLATPALTFPIGTAVAAKQKPVAIADTIPPEPFTPIITSGKPFGYTGKVLVFVAQDKASDILRYEIARSYVRSPNLSDLSWQDAKSPYKLLPSDGDKYLFVRAIDKAHNIRLSIVSPQHLSAVSILHQWLVWILIILGAGVILFLARRRHLHRL